MTGRLIHYNTLATLMKGGFDGTFSFEEVLKNGGIGIGTVDRLDGELVILNHRGYRFDVNGQIHEVRPQDTTPYAAVIDFNAENQVTLNEKIDKDTLEENMSKYFSSKNVFQAVKLHGTFQKIKCRSVQKQEKPYPDLAEVAKDQAEFTAEDMTGTLVGIYTPELFGMISATGFHLHFISDDHSFGGHVLGFEIEQPMIKWQTVDTVEQKFPIDNETFMKTDFDYSSVLADIEEAE
ncbi:acetolactate decarboxylase [Tetragenococcus solitarius]|uniref:Alpha-acetolactate decarboxylase n=1 Tax=Tetragenococcus solitarius TaxID=71453 RepID=A0ABN3YE73_9ENTE|nr:acetolactate decarboxylase [Tetragenococcus solitarius]